MKNKINFLKLMAGCRRLQLLPYPCPRAGLPRPRRFVRRRHRPTPMVVDDPPLSRQMAIDDPALMAYETSWMPNAPIMDWEAQALPVVRGWTGSRVPWPSSPSMVVDQLRPSSSSPQQLGPANPTIEGGLLLSRAPGSPSPASMVVDRLPVFASPFPQSAPLEATMEDGSRSDTLSPTISMLGARLPSFTPSPTRSGAPSPNLEVGCQPTAESWEALHAEGMFIHGFVVGQESDTDSLVSDPADESTPAGSPNSAVTSPVSHFLIFTDVSSPVH
jgi:hypothetical protein